PNAKQLLPSDGATSASARPPSDSVNVSIPSRSRRTTEYLLVIRIPPAENYLSAILGGTGSWSHQYIFGSGRFAGHTSFIVSASNICPFFITNRIDPVL